MTHENNYIDPNLCSLASTLADFRDCLGTSDRSLSCSDSGSSSSPGQRHRSDSVRYKSRCESERSHPHSHENEDDCSFLSSFDHSWSRRLTRPPSSASCNAEYASNHLNLILHSLPWVVGLVWMFLMWSKMA